MVFYVGVYVDMHIYFSVRTSAQRASNKLETSLAKRIGMIVFLNMIFYAVPNLLIAVYTAANINKLPPSEEINLVLRIWLPPVCMIDNACLRTVPTNGKYFFPDNDYVRQVDHVRGY